MTDVLEETELDNLGYERDDNADDDDRYQTTSTRNEETPFGGERLLGQMSKLLSFNREAVEVFFPEMNKDVETGQLHGKLAVRLFGKTTWRTVLTNKGEVREFKGDLGKALGRSKKELYLIAFSKEVQEDMLNEIEGQFLEFNRNKYPFLITMNGEGNILVELKSRENSTPHRLFDDDGEMNESLPGVIKKALGEQIPEGIREKIKKNEVHYC